MAAIDQWVESGSKPQSIPAAHNAFVYVYRGELQIGATRVPTKRMAILANTIDADGVLQDEHIGDASVEGKLKKLLARARESVQKCRNALDRVTQRRNEAVQAAILTALRQRWPKEVAKIEQQAGAPFDLAGGAQ